LHNLPPPTPLPFRYLLGVPSTQLHNWGLMGRPPESMLRASVVALAVQFFTLQRALYWQGRSSMVLVPSATE
jgi:hypothetical protein